MAGAGGGVPVCRTVNNDQPAALVDMSAARKREQVEMTEGASVLASTHLRGPSQVTCIPPVKSLDSSPGWPEDRAMHPFPTPFSNFKNVASNRQRRLKLLMVRNISLLT